jgi:hypothetical protein
MQRLQVEEEYELEEDDEIPMVEETLEEESEEMIEVLDGLEEDEEIEEHISNISNDSREYNLNTDIDGSSDQYNESSEYITPYENYGLERSLAIYLREIGRQPLLTKDDEIALFTQIENGQELIKQAVLGYMGLRLI